MCRDPFAEALAEKLSARLGIGLETIRGAMERPPKPEMGDYAFPCFMAAKALRAPPQKIAASLAAEFPAMGLSDMFERAVATGPYLNFFVNKGRFAASIVNGILDAGERYGSSDVGAGKTVIVEYSSPNIAKPFHVGHLGTTLIGASLSRILASLGYNVVRINHLGDWGVQCGFQLLGWRRWGSEEALRRGGIQYLCDLYVRVCRESEKDPAMEAEARAMFKRLEEGDAELLAVWRRFTEVTMNELEGSYRRLGVEFDLVRGESYYHKPGLEMIAELKRKGLAEESEGAVVVKLDDERLPPCILLKSDEATIYATRDLAAAVDRAKTFGFHKCLYVVDVRQSLHFRQVFAVLKKMGFPWAAGLIHVSFGLMRIQEGDQVLAMSTRGGQMVPLKEFLDRMAAVVRCIVEEKNPELGEHEKATVAEAVGVGAIIFQWLSKRRNSDSVFDRHKATDTRGDSGPYLQYTHARACSILRKFRASAERSDAVVTATAESSPLTGSAPAGGSSPGPACSSRAAAPGAVPPGVPLRADPSLLSHPTELKVAMRLRDFPAAVLSAAEQYEPCVISSYMLELASEFSGFLDACRVLSQDESLTRSRAALVAAVATVLRKGLYLLGIPAPEKM